MSRPSGMGGQRGHLTRPQVRAAAQDLPQEQSQGVDVRPLEGSAPVLKVESLVQQLWSHVPLGASLQDGMREAKGGLCGSRS